MLDVLDVLDDGRVNTGATINDDDSSPGSPGSGGLPEQPSHSVHLPDGFLHAAHRFTARPPGSPGSAARPA